MLVVVLLHYEDEFKKPLFDLPLRNVIIFYGTKRTPERIHSLIYSAISEEELLTSFQVKSIVQDIAEVSQVLSHRPRDKVRIRAGPASGAVPNGMLNE